MSGRTYRSAGGRMCRSARRSSGLTGAGTTAPSVTNRWPAAPAMWSRRYSSGEQASPEENDARMALRARHRAALCDEGLCRRRSSSDGPQGTALGQPRRNTFPLSLRRSPRSGQTMRVAALGGLSARLSRIRRLVRTARQAKAGEQREPEDYRRLVRQVVEDVLHGLPPGAANVREEQRGENETVIILAPRAPGAAPVSVSHIGDAPDSVFVEVGEASVVEVFKPHEGLVRDQLAAVLTEVTTRSLDRLRRKLHTSTAVVTGSRGHGQAPPTSSVQRGGVATPSRVTETRWPNRIG